MSELKANDSQTPAHEWRFAKLARAGATIGAIAMLGAPAVELFRHSDFLKQNLLYAVGALGGVGVILALKPSKIDRTRVEDVLHFYHYARWWGLVFIGVAGIVYYFTPEREEVLRRQSAPSQEPARRRVIVPAPPEEVEMPAPAPPEFPQLKVSGIVINGEKSSAVINSEVVLLGETTSGVRLVAVTNSEITVEYQGFRKVIPALLR